MLEAILIEAREFADQDKPVQRWFQSARSWLNREEEALASRDGLSAGWQFVAFVLVVIALFCRSPRLLTHAQFYAEDGTIWFAQAYNDGWLHSLLLPQAGYLNTMPRLAAGLALLVPLTWAPLVMVHRRLVRPGTAGADSAFGALSQLGFVAHPYVLSRSLCSASQCQRDSHGSHQHPVAPGAGGGAGGLCV